MNPPQGQSAPIFIVGPSRSGTSMLREMLNHHPDVWIVRETHYFDDLRARSDRSPSACEQYFLAIGHRAYGAHADVELSQIDRLELRREAAALGGSPDAYFEAFCRIRARQNGKSRWGEKTPRHVFRIAEILDCFPAAKVICTIRDPRAVVVSYRDWTKRSELDPGLASPFADDRRRARRSYNLVLAALMCKAALAASFRARERFGPGQIFLLSFEELLAAPAESLDRLCGWLEVEPAPQMLDIPVVQSSYAATAAQRGVSLEPRDRWRSQLSRDEVAIIQACCRKEMAELGYAPEPIRVSPHVLARAWIGLLPAAARAGLANRRRMGRPLKYVRRRLSFALGLR